VGTPEAGGAADAQPGAATPAEPPKPEEQPTPPMKGWDAVVDDFGYDHLLGWSELSETALSLDVIPFASPLENRSQALQTRNERINALKAESPGKSNAELFEMWKATVEGKVAHIKAAAGMVGNSGLMRIRMHRDCAPPRLDGPGIARALGSVWVDMGGGDAPSPMEEHFNPSTANPPLTDGEKVPLGTAPVLLQAADWNVFLDDGFVNDSYLKFDPTVFEGTAEGAGAVGAAAPGESGGAGGGEGAPIQRAVDPKLSPAARAARIPSSGGTSLPSSVRTRMEPKLGADLSQVKLHTSDESTNAASSLGARAFTVGTDVHFNAGEFQPGTREGDKLLAHELTHVVQGQRSGVQRKSEDEQQGEGAATAEAGMEAKGTGEEAKADETQVSQPEEPAEKEADQVSEQVTDKLHGAEPGKKKEAGAEPAAPTEEKAPEIGAKLFGAPKVFRTGPAPQPASTGGANPARLSPAEMQAKRVEFEVKLGNSCAETGAGVGVQMVDACRRYLDEKLKPLKEKVQEYDEKRAQLLTATGSAIDTGWAGRVGTSIASLEAVLSNPGGTGLRETFLFAGMFVEKVITPDVFSLPKQELTELCEKAKVGAEAIERHKAKADEAWQTAQAEGRIRATDTPAGHFSGMGYDPRIQQQQGMRQPVAPAARANSGWSQVSRQRFVEELGGSFSPQEEELANGADYKAALARLTAEGKTGKEADEQARKEATKGSCPWWEGAKAFEIKHEHPMSQLAESLNMPTMAGVSGTTARTMRAAEMLNVGPPPNVRMACLGALLPINAHSFFEVMQGAGLGMSQTGKVADYFVDPPGEAAVRAVDPEFFRQMEDSEKAPPT
jgi:hypothetical protein